MPSERVTTQSNGGSWESRVPSFGKTVNALFRRSFLVKIRDAGTIASEIIATVIIVILYILWNFGSRIQVAEPTPLIETADYLWGGLVSLFNKDLALGRGGHWVARPDNQYMEKMIVQYYGAQKIPKVDLDDMSDMSKWVWYNLSERFNYVNTPAEVQESFDSVDAFSNGIGWNNAQTSPTDVEWTKNMSVTLYENQNLIMFFSENMKCVSYQAFGGAGKFRSTVGAQIMAAIEAQVPAIAGRWSIPQFNVTAGSIFHPPIVYEQTFARPEIENELPINIAVAFFAAIPIVIASMPDLTMILSDKDSHVMTFIFLMGASEPAYWLVSFLSTFIMCLPPYIVMDLLFAFGFCMKGTSFTLLLVLTILFIIAYVSFQMFISTFFKTASSGRVLTVIFLILIVFFGYLNEVYTLDAKDSVKHVLSLFPIECYQLIISVMYEEVRNKREPLGWKHFADEKYRYPVYWAFCWLIGDAAIFFILFLLFNATLDRGFGNSLLKWRDIIRCNFKQQKEIQLEDIDEGQYIMQVNNLTKKYSGKQVLAVDDVSFQVKKGEIVVMIGPNGAGKSSIINTISGAIPSTSGTLKLGNDEESSQFSGIQKCLGIVFQDNVIIKLLSIREHLEIFGAFRGIPKDTLQDAIDFFADTLQLKEMLPNRAGDLSGGQKRKLCIALALLGNPPIIIMDEPTAGVDVQARQLIWKTISNLTESTSIITTHALEEAEAVSSRMFVVSRGKMPFIGTSSELRSEFKCGYILKVDCEPEAMPRILEFVKSYVPEAKVLPERDDTIALPVEGTIPKLLSGLDEKKSELGYDDYSFTVEQLEDVLLRILETS